MSDWYSGSVFDPNRTKQTIADQIAAALGLNLMPGAAPAVPPGTQPSLAPRGSVFDTTRTQPTPLDRITSALGFPLMPAPAKPAVAAPPAPTIPANINPALGPSRPPISPDAKNMSLPLGFDPTVSPITLPPPPQMSLPGGVNTKEYKKFLDEARPQSSENLAAVLGGLARGAGSVDATKPGSFAAALAAAGAGGMEGFRESAKDTRGYMERRAGHELDIQKLQAAAGLQRSQIEYNNAHAMYETNVKNLLAQQEAQMKNREMQMPKIQHDANGITVSRVDPTSQTVKWDFTPTKTTLDKAENLVQLNKALGMPGIAAEAQAVQWIQSSVKDPTVANELIRREAANRTIQNGAGQAVFGDEYTAAAKKAQAILQQENPTLATKPDEFQSELNKRIAAILMANPKFNHPGWLQRAAHHGIVPAMIMQGIPVGEAVSGGQ
jgi:hypothetical protein